MAQLSPELNPFRSPPVAPPFSFASATPVAPVNAADAPTHVLLQQGSLEPGEFELSELDTVEVLGCWGSTILFVRHLPVNASFTIGESNSVEPVDFEISAQVLGAERLQIVAAQGGVAQVIVPPAARASVRRAVDPYALPTQAASVALLSGTVVELELGKLKFRIANVPAGKSTPRAGFASVERSLLSSFALSFATVAALMASFALWMPALGLTDGEEIDSESVETMKRYLSASAERNRQEEADKDQSGQKDNQPGTPAEAAQGREGAMGKLNAPPSQHRAAVRGDAPEVRLSRSQVLDAARHFGMIELLGSLPTNAGGGSPFVRDPALGHDGMDAEGGMWGDPGESGGFGGLRLSGLDNGGGGRGEGVALSGNGACLGGNCGPRGFGKDFGRPAGVHPTGAPRIRQAEVTTSGRLPAEVVQRIVRQNYGRFRMCYENGLRSNPNLAGRVTARFVIGREGAVTNVQNGGSDLPDAGVVSCVVQAFYGLSFPTPENGIVTVSYPIMLSPS